MARGSIAKEQITSKILEMFDGAFVYGKELRIPVEENGEEVQIKIALTCAKVNVENGGGASSVATSEPVAPAEKVEVTEEEKQNVQKLMEGLGL
jgi:hypothetical protein